MAIKGKRRSKGKQVAKPPKREPVEVPPPFIQRKSVQVVAAFVAGLLMASLGALIIAGLTAEREGDQTATDNEERTAAASRWEQAVSSALQEVAPDAGQGEQPDVAPAAVSAIDAMSKGKPSDDATTVIADAQESLQKASGALDGFDLSGTIRDKGFDRYEASAFTNSKSAFVAALRLYERAAQLGVEAAAASGQEQVQLATIARGMTKDAEAMFETAWNGYLSALTAAGAYDLVAPPTGQQVPDPAGLPGG
jgi:hypothetical protein